MKEQSALRRSPSLLSAWESEEKSCDEGKRSNGLLSGAEPFLTRGGDDVKVEGHTFKVHTDVPGTGR